MFANKTQSKSATASHSSKRDKNTPYTRREAREREVKTSKTDKSS